MPKAVVAGGHGQSDQRQERSTNMRIKSGRGCAAPEVTYKAVVIDVG